MTTNKALCIKSWIKGMGFKLTKSHSLDHRTKKIKYYTLGNFGVYEESTSIKSEPSAPKKLKFVSWTPWGDNVVINSVKDLSKAYEEFSKINPDAALN